MRLALLRGMLHTNLLRTRFDQRRKVIVLLGVIAMEIVLGAFLWQRSKPGAVVGFLIKNGQRYTVAWKDAMSGYDSHTCASIDEALKFANEELRLSAAANPIREHELEHVWTADRFGTQVVLWRTVGSALNQITFNSQHDAAFF